jgi:predicted nucleotidyltransferase component of viral defense system
MIPRAFLLAWSERAPWPDLRQVEQDLVICRALSDLFRSPDLRGRIAFRGGTAIHKLLLPTPLRYSEDIDLVQVHAGPIGPIIDAVRAALSWLGRCSREQAGHSMHLVFRFTPEVEPESSLRLKVEINTREHGSLLGIREYPFAVRSEWHAAESAIASYEPEEIFGIKLRAFLQRRSGRDLFDLDQGLERLKLDPARVIACFDHCLAQVIDELRSTRFPGLLARQQAE